MADDAAWNDYQKRGIETVSNLIPIEAHLITERGKYGELKSRGMESYHTESFGYIPDYGNIYENSQGGENKVS